MPYTEFLDSLGISPKRPRLFKGLTDNETLLHSRDDLLIVKVDAAYYHGRSRLQHKLEDISDRDSFYELIESINSTAEAYQLKDVQHLIAQCDRPHSLLQDEISTPSSSGVSWVNPYEKIEALRSSLLTLSKRVKKRTLYSDLACSISKVAEYYERYVDEVKVHPFGPDGFVPPIILKGSGLITQRVITPSVANIILGARQNSYGLRTVNSYNGVHFKRDPDAPGHEFAVDALNKLVSGGGSASSELIKIDMGSRSFSLQTSMSVNGINLKKVLDERPDLLDVELGALQLDNYSYSFIMGLLTNLNDAKPENYIVKFSQQAEGKTSGFKIVGVDNDMAFADPIGVSYEVRNENGEYVGWDSSGRKVSSRMAEGHDVRKRYFVNVRNIFYCMPQADLPIHSEVRQRLLHIQPAILLLEWLRLLYQQNAHYTSTNRNVATFAHGTWSQEELEQLQLPLRLRPGSVSVIYQTFQLIQDILVVNPRATHNEIFQTIQPDLFHYYQGINDSSESIGEAFEKIFRGPYFSDVVDMDSVEVDTGCTLREFLNQNEYNSNALAFITDRSLTPLEAMGEFLASIDFQEVPYQAQSLALDIVCHMPHRNFILVGCQALSDRHLQLVLESSPGLQSLELIRCPNVTDLGMKLIHFRSLSIPRISVTNCLRVTDAALDLLRTDPRVTVQVDMATSRQFGRAYERDRSFSQVSNTSASTSSASLHLTRISKQIAKQARRSSAPVGSGLTSHPLSHSASSIRRRARKPLPSPTYPRRMSTSNPLISSTTLGSSPPRSSVASNSPRTTSSPLAISSPKPLPPSHPPPNLATSNISSSLPRLPSSPGPLTTHTEQSSHLEHSDGSIPGEQRDVASERIRTGSHSSLNHNYIPARRSTAGDSRNMKKFTRPQPPPSPGTNSGDPASATMSSPRYSRQVAKESAEEAAPRPVSMLSDKKSARASLPPNFLSKTLVRNDSFIFESGSSPRVKTDVMDSLTLFGGLQVEGGSGSRERERGEGERLSVRRVSEGTNGSNTGSESTSDRLQRSRSRELRGTGVEGMLEEMEADSPSPFTRPLYSSSSPTGGSSFFSVVKKRKRQSDRVFRTPAPSTGDTVSGSPNSPYNSSSAIPASPRGRGSDSSMVSPRRVSTSPRQMLHRHKVRPSPPSSPRYVVDMNASTDAILNSLTDTDYHTSPRTRPVRRGSISKSLSSSSVFNIPPGQSSIDSRRELRELQQQFDTLTSRFYALSQQERQRDALFSTLSSKISEDAKMIISLEAENNQLRTQQRKASARGPSLKRDSVEDGEENAVEEKEDKVSDAKDSPKNRRRLAQGKRPRHSSKRTRRTSKDDPEPAGTPTQPLPPPRPSSEAPSESPPASK